MQMKHNPLIIIVITYVADVSVFYLQHFHHLVVLLFGSKYKESE